MRYIDKMKDSASFGHNKLDAKTIKIAKYVLISPITYVINLSILSSKIPNKWRVGSHSYIQR